MTSALRERWPFFVERCEINETKLEISSVVPSRSQELNRAEYVAIPVGVVQLPSTSFLVLKLLLGNTRLGSSASRSARTATNVTPPNINEITSCSSLDEPRNGVSKRFVPKQELGNEGIIEALFGSFGDKLFGRELAHFASEPHVVAVQFAGIGDLQVISLKVQRFFE